MRPKKFWIFLAAVYFFMLIVTFSLSAYFSRKDDKPAVKPVAAQNNLSEERHKSILETQLYASSEQHNSTAASDDSAVAPKKAQEKGALASYGIEINRRMIFLALALSLFLILILAGVYLLAVIFIFKGRHPGSLRNQIYNLVVFLGVFVAVYALPDARAIIKMRLVSALGASLAFWGLFRKIDNLGKK
ncbi:MAG: hypothetical protein JW788_03970 [Candidatus Omnitrophica bacterium]|nr:hypothetical protein [Candidatus Omnitrophota bacterium]